MSFTADVVEANAQRCADIRAMPFNARLADGTLPPEIFRRYVIQDAHYLEGFARALARAAAVAPDAAAVAQLSGAAAGAIAVERRLHEHYLALYVVDAATFAATEPSPACDHYVCFLIAAASRGVAEGVAALLPCFWVYRDVGHAIHGLATPDNPYRAWIDTYASAEFDAAVTAMADRLAAAAGADERARMRAAFARSVMHEWLFWDGAWRGRGWPDTAAA
jgi:thiaminase/transcriptional activator TenA